MKRPAAKPSKLLQGMLGIKKPTREEKYRAALAGDWVAVEWLRFDKPEQDDKLQLVIDMCRDGCHKPTFRRLLLECLIDNPPQLRPSAPDGRVILSRLVDYAAFAHDPSVPESLTLYRGTHSVSVQVASTGFFWTPDPIYAAEYADGPYPLVLRAEVPLSDVAVFYSPLETLYPAFQHHPSLDHKTRSWEAVLLKPPASVHLEDEVVLRCKHRELQLMRRALG